MRQRGGADSIFLASSSSPFQLNVKLYGNCNDLYFNLEHDMMNDCKRRVIQMDSYFWPTCFYSVTFECRALLYFITIISAHANYNDAFSLLISTCTHIHTHAESSKQKKEHSKSLLKLSSTLKHILNECLKVSATDAINLTPKKRGKITREREWKREKGRSFV